MAGGNDWEWFINQFEKLSGIDLTAYKRQQMERRINSFMRTTGSSDYNHFISVLKTDTGIYERFVQHITINVSEFFRNYNHWKVLADEILPELMQKHRKMKIWSAGCSTGEEAYTLAILAKEKNLPLDGKIIATDIDKGVLEKAAIGLYGQKALEAVPRQYMQKYFIPQGDYFRVSDELKDLVVFQRQDLIKDKFSSGFSLILCRNVVIYFTEESKNQLYKKFTESLLEHGILFIGSTEQIFQARSLGLSSRATFFYQKQMNS